VGKCTRRERENRAPKVLTRASNFSEPERTTAPVRTLKIQKNNNKERNKEGKGREQQKKDTFMVMMNIRKKILLW
jgi:hypothetical protein